jgi:excinuclease UvrABC helicase subunit UvrB
MSDPDASVVIVVNVSEATYLMQTSSALQTLHEAGFEARALTGQLILDYADQIRSQLAEGQT